MNIEFLRKFCLSLPAATEDIKWGADLCFSVGGKMFCVTSIDGPLKISFKVPDEDFEELAAQEGFIPAPYMARNKWVLLTDVNANRCKCNKTKRTANLHSSIVRADKIQTDKKTSKRTFAGMK